MSLIRANNLVKTYGNRRALDGFNMTVEAGKIVGLIGANGSGKTTALKSLMGLCQLDTGELSVLGLAPQEQRATLMQRTSYIADTGTLPRWMRVRDVLRYVDGVQPAFDIHAARERLAQTEVTPDARIRTLSKGMTVQLHLAIVLACDIELLVLDEPTLGLDILYRQAFYDTLLNDHFDTQRAIVITTHEIDEVEHILTDVVFIDHGQNVLTSPMDQIGQRFTQVVAALDNQQALQALAPLRLRRTIQGVTAIFENGDTDELETLGAVSVPSLADLFVAFVGAAQ